MRPALALPVLVLLAACGGSPAPRVAGPAPSTTASPTPAPVATSSPEPQPEGVPHFDTPEQAMRYLAAAWNAMDTVKLKHVTTRSARAALEVMRHEATNLQLDHCTLDRAEHDYDCTFTHDFPSGYRGHDPSSPYKQTDHPGTASFVVGPADRSGWYMTVLEDCG